MYRLTYMQIVYQRKEDQKEWHVCCCCR